MSRRIAVTGARGFIGRHLTERLSARGDEVAKVTIRTPCDERAIVDVFRRVELVINLAGVISSVHESDYVSGNVDCTRAVAQGAREAGARLIHISSLAAAGPAPAEAPRDEDDPPMPITTYGRTKLEGERAIEALDGLRWTILRPGVVYGPRDRALLPLFRSASRGVLPLAGRRSAAYAFIHISDMVRAIEAAIDREADRETLFTAHPAPLTVTALLDHVQRAVGGRVRTVRVPGPLLWLAAITGDVAGRVAGRPMAINRRRYAEMMSVGFACRVDRLRDRLGIVAQTDHAAGFAQTAEWYRREGWI